MSPPRVLRRDDGSDVWLYEGTEIVNIGLKPSPAGRPPEEYGMEPTSDDEMRPGSENPFTPKLPWLHSHHWEPFWQACEDEGTIVCLHIDAPIEVPITLQPINIVQAAADLMWFPCCAGSRR